MGNKQAEGNGVGEDGNSCPLSSDTESLLTTNGFLSEF